MGEQRKRDILKLAREFDLVVIEDDPCVPLSFMRCLVGWLVACASGLMHFPRPLVVPQVLCFVRLQTRYYLMGFDDSDGKQQTVARPTPAGHKVRPINACTVAGWLLSLTSL
jgi:hypothetical protein